MIATVERVKKFRANFRYWDLIALAALYAVVVAGYVGQTAFSFYSGAWGEVRNTLKAKYYWSLLQPALAFVFFAALLRLALTGKYRSSVWVMAVFLTLWFSFAPSDFLSVSTIMLVYFLSFIFAGMVCYAYTNAKGWLVTSLLVIGGVLTFGFVAFHSGEGAAARSFEMQRALGMFARHVRLDGGFEFEKATHVHVEDVYVAAEYSLGGSSVRTSLKRRVTVDWQLVPVFPNQGEQKTVSFLLYCEGDECRDLSQISEFEGFVKLIAMKNARQIIRPTSEDEEEVHFIADHLKEHHLKYADTLVVFSPGKLKDQSVPRLITDVRQNIVHWSWFMAVVTLVQLLLAGKRRGASRVGAEF